MMQQRHQQQEQPRQYQTNRTKKKRSRFAITTRNCGQVGQTSRLRRHHLGPLTALGTQDGSHSLSISSSSNNNNNNNKRSRKKTKLCGWYTCLTTISYSMIAYVVSSSSSGVQSSLSSFSSLYMMMSHVLLSPSPFLMFSIAITFVLQPTVAMSTTHNVVSTDDSKQQQQQQQQQEREKYNRQGNHLWWSTSSLTRRRHSCDSKRDDCTINSSTSKQQGRDRSDTVVTTKDNGIISKRLLLNASTKKANNHNCRTSTASGWKEQHLPLSVQAQHFEIISKSVHTNTTTTTTTAFPVDKHETMSSGFDSSRVHRGLQGNVNDGPNPGIVSPSPSLYNTKLPITLSRQLSRRLGTGRITCDFGTRQSKYYGRPPQSLLVMSDADGGRVNSGATFAVETSASETNNVGYSRLGNNKVRISIDPQAFGRLVPIAYVSCTTFLSAFMATLRLLAPLVISKRILCSMGNLISDWYTGRYFRKTYTRLEKIYIHYYETPATFRALLRTVSQWCIYLLLGKLMGYLVGITHKPCRSEGRGLALTCGLLWVGSVVGTGHAFAEAVARWGGPLRLQAVKHIPKRRLVQVFTRPWHILHWMQNPEQWIDMIAEPERRPFDPNPVLFPVTWIPLRLLQMVAVARVVSTDPKDYLWCPADEGDQVPKILGKFLLQLALCDEWYRVFIREKRVGLGIAVMIFYYFTMLSLLVSSAMLNGRATLLMVPSFLALIVSGWMNIVIFWNRYETSRRKERTPMARVV